MKRFLFLVILFTSELIFAQFPNYLVDSIVVKKSKDTVFVWDYNAWEQCAFKLDYSIKIVDSVITISQVDIAKDMTTCYGYHNFVFPIVGLSNGKYRIDIYRDCLYQDNRFIKSFRFEYIISSVSQREQLPNHFILYDAYPNPFNPSTKISYRIPNYGHVLLKIYNSLGQEISTLVSKNQEAGEYIAEFNAKGFASGFYYYRLQFNNIVETKKILLLK
jgi:hypothetical protein